MSPMSPMSPAGRSCKKYFIEYNLALNNFISCKEKNAKKHDLPAGDIGDIGDSLVIVIGFLPHDKTCLPLTHPCDPAVLFKDAESAVCAGFLARTRTVLHDVTRCALLRVRL